MSNDTTITVVGNLTANPELRYTQSGTAVASFTVASTPRHFDKQRGEFVDDDPLFLRASVWRDFAEHVAKSLTKGARVVVQGRLRQRGYETKQGEKRTSYEIDVDEIGPSLRYATATVVRADRNGAPASQNSGNAQSPQGWGDAPQTSGWGAPQNPDTPF